PPRSPPLPMPTLVTKKVILAGLGLLPRGGVMPCVLNCASGWLCCASSSHAASMKKEALFAILVTRETVEQAYAVRVRQIRLGTSALSVSGVPGAAAAAIAIRKTDLGVEPAIGGIEAAASAARGWTLAAGPVVAGVSLRIRERGAI